MEHFMSLPLTICVISCGGKALICQPILASEQKHFWSNAKLSSLGIFDPNQMSKA